MTRQAVILIHGIGEQKPMETLRGFVDAVWRRNPAIHNPFAARHAHALVFSKPDSVSRSFELRQLTTPQNSGGIVTDFFELYWQHLMQGTTYGHVVAWAKTLLLRAPSTLPGQLLPVYWLLWLAVLVAAGLALYTWRAASLEPDARAMSPWVSGILSLLVVPLAGLVIRNIVGDAARYLHVAPANVQRRHEIRLAGVELLDELHGRNYDRIIVVGHSLGSVIGYDMLTHAWPKYNRHTPAAPGAPMAALDRLEDLATSAAPPTDAAVQAAQHAYADEIKANGCRWRVTDFITLGSPLAHAQILLARDKAELRLKQNDREFPTCLPTLETFTRGGDDIQRFSFELDRDHPRSYRVPHHAAVFGPTSWTNLYFPNSLIVRGDLIGGPLAPVFGDGVRDVPVETTLRGGLLSHTLYWRSKTFDPAPRHIQQLRDALDLAYTRRPAAAGVAVGP